MAREKAEDVLSYCRRELGECLRAVTYYSYDDHDPIYTRANVPDEIELDEEMRGMFRTPLVQLQKAVQQLADVHPTLDDPVTATYAYGNISVVQFPITRDEGVIVTVDSEGHLPDEFESHCRSLLNGDDGSTAR